jgi:hypothetical protein
MKTALPGSAATDSAIRSVTMVRACPSPTTPFAIASESNCRRQMNSCPAQCHGPERPAKSCGQIVPTPPRSSAFLPGSSAAAAQPT